MNGTKSHVCIATLIKTGWSELRYPLIFNKDEMI